MTGNSNSNPFRGRWAKASCQVPGSGHLERDVPCQDRAGAWLAPRPCLMILDGRGSASLSHLGAAAAREALRTALRKWEPQLKTLLDEPGHELAAVGWQGFARMLYHVAGLEQTKLAAWYDTGCDHFEFTLTLAVVGCERIGWLAVGDSPLVISRHGIAGLATPLDETGFANQTTFVVARPQGRLGLLGGVIPSVGVTALLAMSDGAATRLLELKQQTPAPAISELIACAASDRLHEAVLREMLKDAAWDRITRDDRSIALLSLRTASSAIPEDSGEQGPVGIRASSENRKATTTPARKPAVSHSH